MNRNIHHFKFVPNGTGKYAIKSEALSNEQPEVHIVIYQLEIAQYL